MKKGSFLKNYGFLICMLIGIVAGYGLVAFMAFTSSLSLASSAVLLGYGLVWMLLTAVVCSAVSK